jgi:hypothetical protein
VVFRMEQRHFFPKSPLGIEGRNNGVGDCEYVWELFSHVGRDREFLAGPLIPSAEFDFDLGSDVGCVLKRVWIGEQKRHFLSSFRGRLKLPSGLPNDGFKALRQLPEEEGSARPPSLRSTRPRKHQQLLESGTLKVTDDAFALTAAEYRDISFLSWLLQQQVTRTLVNRK